MNIGALLTDLTSSSDRKFLGNGKLPPLPTRTIAPGDKLPPAQRAHSPSSDEESGPEDTGDDPRTLLFKHHAPGRKHLVQEKFQLGILSSRETDLSDVVRHVGASNSNRNRSEGIKFYVDPTPDPEIGEIVIVKKMNHVALDGMRLVPAFGEVTNVPHVKEKEKEYLKLFGRFIDLLVVLINAGINNSITSD